MAVAAHDHEICVCISGMRQQRVFNIKFAAHDMSDFHLESVTGEVTTHVDAFDVILLAALTGNTDHFDVSRSLEKRHGVGDGARGWPTSVPTDHDAVELEWRCLDIWHD